MAQQRQRRGKGRSGIDKGEERHREREVMFRLGKEVTRGFFSRWPHGSGGGGACAAERGRLFVAVEGLGR